MARCRFCAFPPGESRISRQPPRALSRGARQARQRWLSRNAERSTHNRMCSGARISAERLGNPPDHAARSRARDRVSSPPRAALSPSTSPDHPLTQGPARRGGRKPATRAVPVQRRRAPGAARNRPPALAKHPGPPRSGTRPTGQTHARAAREQGKAADEGSRGDLRAEPPTAEPGRRGRCRAAALAPFPGIPGPRRAATAVQVFHSPSQPPDSHARTHNATRAEGSPLAGAVPAPLTSGQTTSRGPRSRPSEARAKRCLDGGGRSASEGSPTRAKRAMRASERSELRPPTERSEVTPRRGQERGLRSNSASPPGTLQSENGPQPPGGSHRH